MTLGELKEPTEGERISRNVRGMKRVGMGKYLLRAGVKSANTRFQLTSTAEYGIIPRGKWRNNHVFRS